MHPYTKGIYSILKKHGNKADAILMKKYMRDQFEFFGIRSVQRRELCKAYLNTQPIHDWTAIKVIVKELWSLPERELHYFAIELLMKFKKNGQVKMSYFLNSLSCTTHGGIPLIPLPAMS